MIEYVKFKKIIEKLLQDEQQKYNDNVNFFNSLKDDDIILDELYLKEVVYKIYKTVYNYGSYIDSSDIKDYILYNKKIDIPKAFKQLKYLKFVNCIQFTKKIDNINKDRCIALNELYELLFTLDIIQEYDNIKVLYDKGYRKFKINNIIIEILINDCLDCKM